MGKKPKAVSEGTLTVTESEDQIVVTASNAEKLYDGSPLTEEGEIGRAHV